jgi:hypothetical protein
VAKAGYAFKAVLVVYTLPVSAKMAPAEFDTVRRAAGAVDVDGPRVRPLKHDECVKLSSPLSSRFSSS